MRRTILLFIAIVSILSTLGILVLASASSVKYENASYFWVRQLIWLAIAFFAAAITARLDYRCYKEWVIPLVFLSFLLLILVRIPGIGSRINGSWRWIRIGPVNIQPSEFSKLALIVLFAWWMSRKQRHIDEPKHGIFVPLGFLGCFAVPILAEPDFGTVMLISSVAFGMMFLGGAAIFPLLLIGVLGLFSLLLLIFQHPERMGRILAFLDPRKYEQEGGWQLANSMRAFANGSRENWFYGRGFGNSMQKHHYLPEAHTDFIFPIIGEELGLIASLAVVCMFAMLFVLGLRISLHARDDFGRLLAFGITLMITIQALTNFAVVTGCVPTKGIALPFISYGGSSLVTSCAMTGILVNVAHLSKSSHSSFRGRIRNV